MGRPARVLALNDEAAEASYPADVARRLGLKPHWAPVHRGEGADADDNAMPTLKALTEGLEAMLS